MAVDRRRRATFDLHPTLDDAEKHRLFRRGVELFDQGLYFQAHEPWETIWRSRNPEPRELYRGLVQIAAGFHHWFERGRAAPAARLLERGARRLEPFLVEGDAWCWRDELDIADLLVTLAAWRDWLALRAGAPPPPPRLTSARRAASP